jgi:hypothetical protein
MHEESLLLWPALAEELAEAQRGNNLSETRFSTQAWFDDRFDDFLQGMSSASATSHLGCQVTEMRSDDDSGNAIHLYNHLPPSTL